MIRAHSITLTDELWAAIEARYPARERSPAIEALLRAALALPAVEREQGGRFVSEVSDDAIRAAVAKHGTYAAAGRALGVQADTVSRRMRAMTGG